MRALARLAERIGASRRLVPIISRIQTPIDRVLIGRSHGRFHTMPGEFPTLLLATTGWRTGRIRTVPLLYVVDGDAVAVTDTNYGRETRPGWSANLLHRPNAAVEIGHETRPVLARRAVDDERARLWAALAEMWPNFTEYAARLERTPRVWVLDRA